MKKSPFAWHSRGVVHCLHLGLTMFMGLGGCPRKPRLSSRWLPLGK